MVEKRELLHETGQQASHDQTIRAYKSGSWNPWRLRIALQPVAVRISIVIPVLNEGLLITDFLAHLRQNAPGAELIVVDGNSSDNTAERAAFIADQLLQTRPGRGIQMNAGAAAAHGEILWFLHVDTFIPSNATAEIRNELSRRRVVGGFFRVRFPRDGFVYRLTDTFAHYAGLLLGIRCGDHGFFCRRDIFEQIGGFSEVPLMEDVDFFRKLSRTGSVAVVGQALLVDPRRYEAVGPWRVTIGFALIWFLYFLRLPRTTLLRVYRRFCCRDLRSRLLN